MTPKPFTAPPDVRLSLSRSCQRVGGSELAEGRSEPRGSHLARAEARHRESGSGNIGEVAAPAGREAVPVVGGTPVDLAEPTVESVRRDEGAGTDAC
jgi:hypothetical protein